MDVLIILCLLVNISQYPLSLRIIGSQAASQYKLALFHFPYSAVGSDGPVYPFPRVKSSDLSDDWNFGVYVVFGEDFVYLILAQFPVLLRKRVYEGRDYECRRVPAGRNVLRCREYGSLKVLSLIGDEIP